MDRSRPRSPVICGVNDLDGDKLRVKIAFKFIGHNASFQTGYLLMPLGRKCA
jgi:hypothetical protein